MVELLSEQHPIARKDHSCDACVWLKDGGYPEGMSISEWRSIVKAKRKGWKIKAGEKYLRQNSKQDGELICFKAIPEIDEICCKYDLYQD